MREKPNFGHTVRWIHTTDGGSCPLPVLHTFCTSASDNSWCLIFDNCLYAHGCLTCLSTVSQKCGAVSSVCVGWPQLPLVAEMRPCPHRSAGGSALPASVHTCMWTQEKHNIEHTVWEYYIIASLFSSLGSEFSSQGHFHSLQLLNVSQFLFCRVVRLKTAPRNNFSHT